MKRNYFVFRIGYEFNFVREELKKGILRQGWGKENMSLLSENGSQRSKEEWIKDYFWSDTKESSKKTRYNILKRMLKMKKGDIVIIPKFPEQHCLTVAKIKEGYNFDGKEIKSDDFGHFITLEKKDMREFEYDENEYTKTISGSFKYYRSAVNNINKQIIRENFEKLYEISNAL